MSAAVSFGPLFLSKTSRTTYAADCNVKNSSMLLRLRKDVAAVWVHRCARESDDANIVTAMLESNPAPSPNTSDCGRWEGVVSPFGSTPAAFNPEYNIFSDSTSPVPANRLTSRQLSVAELVSLDFTVLR